MDGKYDHPNVFVDGDPATNLQYLDDVKGAPKDRGDYLEITNNLNHHQ